MKFDVTPELSKLLRMLRTQNAVSSKKLASHIGKSPSYVSKLESGDVKSIRQEDLTEILSFISGGGDFYESVLPTVVRVLSTFLEPGRAADQLWLLQYDVMERQVMVSEAMTEDILAHLREGEIGIPDLVSLMDANLDSELSSAFSANELVSISYEGRSRLLIHVNFTEDEVERVLLKKESRVGFFCIYNIVHSMFRMLHFPNETKKLPPDKAVALLHLVATYMEQWNIRSLMNFSQMVSSEEFISHQLPLAEAGITVIDNISDIFHEIARRDTLLAARQLNTFYDTLNWDAAFIMRVLGIPFSNLENISFQNKKHLLEDIMQLVEKYDQMSDFDKKLESY